MGKTKKVLEDENVEKKGDVVKDEKKVAENGTATKKEKKAATGVKGTDAAEKKRPEWFGEGRFEGKSERVDVPKINVTEGTKKPAAGAKAKPEVKVAAESEAGVEKKKPWWVGGATDAEAEKKRAAAGAAVAESEAAAAGKEGVAAVEKEVVGGGGGDGGEVKSVPAAEVEVEEEEGDPRFGGDGDGSAAGAPGAAGVPEGTGSLVTTGVPEGGDAPEGTAVPVAAAAPAVADAGGKNSNKWSAGQTNSATLNGGEEQSHSEGETVTEKYVDPERLAELKKIFGESEGSATVFLKKLLGDYSDPDKVAEKNKEADRRRRQHEIVEATRLAIEGMTGGFHGRIIKRDKANYKQYEDEKEKNNALYRSAIDKLYQAMAADAKASKDLQTKLMELATVTRQKTANESGKLHSGYSSSQTNTASVGYGVPSRVTVSNKGQKSVYTYALRVEHINEKGETDQRQVNLQFKNGKAGYDGYMTAAANIVNTNEDLRKRVTQAMRLVYPDIKEEQIRQVLYNGYYTGYMTDDKGKRHAYKVDNAGLRESVLLDMLNDSQELRDIANGYIENMSEYEDMRQAVKKRPKGSGYKLDDQRESKETGGAYGN